LLIGEDWPADGADQESQNAELVEALLHMLGQEISTRLRDRALAGLACIKPVAKQLANEGRHRDVFEARSLLDSVPQAALHEEPALH